MRAVLIRIATLDAQNVIDYVYVAIVSIWVVMVITSIFSVRRLEIRAAAKIAWVVTILALPIVGMGAYCVRCLVKAEYPLLQQLGLFSRDRRLRQVKEA